MKKEKKDQYYKQRILLADKLLTKKDFKFKSSAGLCWFNKAIVEDDINVNHEYVSYIKTVNGKYNIHGWGKSRKDATINCLKHIESMGTIILEYMSGWSAASEAEGKTRCLKQCALGQYKPKKQKKLKLS